jgi:uncharacterized protein YcbK (DUF882 family)
MSLPRVGWRAALASALLMAFAGAVKDATAVSETRTLSFYHTHSQENVTVTFKRNGRYDDEGLKKLNWFLRDWRSQDQTKMNPQLFDILWEVYRDVDGKQPIQIISAYRAPATNSMLRRRSSGVARHSLHMQGMAIDFFIPGSSLEQIRYAGLKLQRGGVGFYPTSGSPFVHLDVGNVRAWPRLSREQLVRLFPDGRTVHLPADGTPLPGYALAQADIQRRSGDGEAAPSGKTFLASLFGKKGSDDDEDDAPSAAPSRSTAVAANTAIGDAIPMPRARPQAAYQVASAMPARTVTLPAPQVSSQAPRSPADIINSRGFWEEVPPAQNDDARRALVLAAADRAPTAAIQASVSQAMAYAPARPAAQVVTASAPVPSFRSLPGREAPAVSELSPVPMHQQAALSVSPRTRATETSAGRKPWTRAIMLAPNAHHYLTTTIFGDADMTSLRAQMEKPRKSVVMTFAADPQGGIVAHRFSGAALAQLPTLDFSARNVASR